MPSDPVLHILVPTRVKFPIMSDMLFVLKVISHFHLKSPFYTFMLMLKGLPSPKWVESIGLFTRWNDPFQQKSRHVLERLGRGNSISFSSFPLDSFHLHITICYQLAGQPLNILEDTVPPQTHPPQKPQLYAPPSPKNPSSGEQLTQSNPSAYAKHNALVLRGRCCFGFSCPQ